MCNKQLSFFNKKNKNKIKNHKINQYMHKYVDLILTYKVFVSKMSFTTQLL